MRRFLLPLLLPLLFLLPVSVWGQGFVHRDVILSASGRPIAGATVTVCLAVNGVGIPCAPTTTIYTTETLGTAKSNPFTADGRGNLDFAVAPGAYIVTITGTGITGYSYRLTVPAGIDATNRPILGSGAGVRFGGAGTGILRVLYTDTESMDFTALAANSCETITTTVTGAASGDLVTLGIPDALADVDGGTERTTFFGWVSGSNTVSVRRCNHTADATADPAAATVQVGVWQISLAGAP